MRKKIKVAVLMGGKSPEYEVSLVSGREVVKHLDTQKYEVLPVVVSKDGKEWLLKGVKELLATVKDEVSSVKDLVPTEKEVVPDRIPEWADVVFLAMHGPYGEDGTIQGMLEIVGIPYTGSGVLASALGMDKPMFRKIIQGAGIPSPKFLVLGKNERPDRVLDEFDLPLVVKPCCQGSSIGVSIVRSKANLEKALQKAFDFGSQAIVEEFLSGVEVTCGILGNDNPIALPVAEIIPKKEFFDYESKYVPEMSEEIVPARIPAKLTKKVQETALKVYQLIGCCGFGRVDMIISHSTPYVLEINTIPGLTPNSLLPKEAAAAGITYQQLIEKIIQFAMEKKISPR